MSTLLFSLRGVPEEEANEIRTLLIENSIDYYETSAGNWGISMPALWIVNNEKLIEAQELLDKYHQQRAIRQREIYQQLKEKGGNKHLIDVIFEKPIRFTIYISAIAFIIYLYFKMLFEFGL